MNKIILIIVIVLIVITGGYFLLRRSFQTPAPAPTAPVVKELTVSGTEYSFDPSSITVSANERVKIIFRNEGRAPHNLIVEELGVATKIIGAGQTDTFEFTVPASDTYTFFCSVPGHRASGMEGTLKVE